MSKSMSVQLPMKREAKSVVTILENTDNLLAPTWIAFQGLSWSVAVALRRSAMPLHLVTERPTRVRHTDRNMTSLHRPLTHMLNPYESHDRSSRPLGP
jgi:hypothetical protein